MNENYKTVKNTLGLTLKSIADRTGVTTTTVSRIIRGKMNPSENWIEAFCKSYHINQDWLINGDGAPVFTDEVSGYDMQDSAGAGKRLVQMRQEIGMGQKAIYEMLGITQTMYSRIENGHARLTVENAKKIEDAFGIGSDWILYGDETRKLYPLGRRMIDFLWRHQEERKRLWKLMKDEKPLSSYEHEIPDKLN